MSETSSEVWSAFFKGELDEAFVVKQRLEERAEKVVAGNGTIVTLLFAIAAFVVNSGATLQPSGWVLLLLALALGGFALSAIFGFLVSRPRRYLGPNEECLSSGVIDDDDMWSQSADAADESHRLIAELRLELTTAATEQNNAKARLLSRSIGAAAGGISALSGALLVGLVQG